MFLLQAFLWNSLPNSVVETDTVRSLKARLDKFWLYQKVKFDFSVEGMGF